MLEGIPAKGDNKEARDRRKEESQITWNSRAESLGQREVRNRAHLGGWVKRNFRLTALQKRIRPLFSASTELDFCFFWM